MPRLDPTQRREYQREYMRKRRADPAWRALQHQLTDEDRFWSKIIKSQNCWLWIGGLDRDGYGRAHCAGKQAPAHRMAYELLVGPIPPGLVLDHLCRVRNCVNPVHLEPVTSRENTLRGITPAVTNALKTHCFNGHKFTVENTRFRGSSRICRACHRELMRRKRLEAAS